MHRLGEELHVASASGEVGLRNGWKPVLRSAVQLSLERIHPLMKLLLECIQRGGMLLRL